MFFASVAILRLYVGGRIVDIVRLDRRYYDAGVIPPPF